MAIKLQDSFAELYRLLERPGTARLAVAALLVIHTSLLAYSAYVHSPTLNEPGHLVAGLSQWEFGRFDVYNVNPPLVKMIAALPVVAVGYKADWSRFYEGPGARPEIGMGEDFVSANGERSFFLFMIARWACIPFSWIGVIVCYLWARDLYGRPAGVLASTIWCFEPNILAHAPLFTPDAHATALGLAACYTFWRWLKNPTWIQAALTGVILGLAELAKTTLILFYPLWPLMWLVYRWSDRRGLFARDWLREAGMLALRMAIGLYVLNLGYAFEGSFKQLNEFHFVSNLFTGTEIRDPRSNNNSQSEIRYPKSVNRFSENWQGKLPVPLPKNYLLGIDLQQKDFEQYGRPSYLCGKWREHGWWYYYLYACAIKVPLGIWLLGLFVLLDRIAIVYKRYRQSRKSSKTEYSDPKCLTPDTRSLNPSSSIKHSPTSFRDEFILLFPALVIFSVVSSKTGFSEHMRYVLPAFPFFIIGLSQVVGYVRIDGRFKEKWLTKVCRLVYKGGGAGAGTRPMAGEERMDLSSAALLVFTVCWSTLSSLWIYPHSLSYFNESIGGPMNGPKHLLGSNADWGQDLKYLQQSLGRNPTRSPLKLAYFGYLCPADLGVSSTGSNTDDTPYLLEAASTGNWNPQGDEQLSVSANRSNWRHAISVNLLYGMHWPVRDAKCQRLDYVSPSLMKRLRAMEADASGGYSISVFNLNPAER